MSKSSVLENYVNTHSTGKVKKLLPYIHSCEAKNAETIIYENKLQTSMCKEFNKNLIYYFLGRPAYPAGDKEQLAQSSDLTSPVCFIIDPSDVKIVNAYPFDSGAFLHERYKGFIHRTVDISTYLLSTTDEVIKYIDTFFGNYENYMEEKPIAQADTGYSDIDSLIGLMSTNAPKESDERCCTVELISNKNITISGNVMAIVLPHTLLKKKNIINNMQINDILNSYNIQVISYHKKPNTLPISYHQLICEEVHQYLVSKGYVNDWG